jgi:hypothetical protein
MSRRDLPWGLLWRMMLLLVSAGLVLTGPVITRFA